MAWRFEPDEELSAAFRRVALQELAKVRAALTSGAEREVAIHQARRSFKKLRALARLARPSLGASFRTENRRWRDAGRLLSGTRDATVMAQRFDRVAERCRDDVAAEEVQALRAAISTGAPDGRDGADRHPQVAQVIEIVDRAAAEIDGLQWPRTRKDVVQALRESQDRLRRSWKEAGKHASSDALHDWRKRVKDLAAQLSLFRAGLSDGLKARRRTAKELGEVLGEEHDLCMLAEKLAGAAVDERTGEAREHLLAVIGERRQELRRIAFETGDDLSSERGKTFARQLVDSWDRAASSRNLGGGADLRARQSSSAEGRLPVPETRDLI